MQATPQADQDIRIIVQQMLNDAIMQQASDIHVEPTAEGYEIRHRIDGLLKTIQSCNSVFGRSVVLRMMVMAELLTYRQNIPQEGRISFDRGDEGITVDLRLAIMPTTHGLRAAVRMPAELLQPRTLDDLQLPTNVLSGLKQFAVGDGGMLLLTGPAGSGKTTTIYALLRYIAEVNQGLSIIALEDPVERNLPNVTQIEVSPFGELSYEVALRSILRQDPQVLMIGEIRDSATASIAVQAALSGHRLISTLHAGTTGGAIARLLEMDIEPFQIASSLYGVVAQRLIRRCDENGKYHGRIPVASMAVVDDGLRRRIVDRVDAASIQQWIDQRDGANTLADCAETLMREGLTDRDEIKRVLGNDIVDAESSGK